MIRVLLDLFEDWLNSSCIESFLAHGTSASVEARPASRCALRRRVSN